MSDVGCGMTDVRMGTASREWHRLPRPGSKEDATVGVAAGKGQVAVAGSTASRTFLRGVPDIRDSASGFERDGLPRLIWYIRHPTSDIRHPSFQRCWR